MLKIFTYNCACVQVYGVTEARVEVGYQYRDCAAAVRVTQLARLQGFPVDISQVGGWNLDIHHHYNPHQGDGDTGHVARTRGDGDTCAGILQRGDGSSLDLASLGPVLETLMGDGGQRDFQCEKSACKGKLTRQPVFSNFSLNLTKTVLTPVFRLRGLPVPAERGEPRHWPGRLRLRGRL